MFDVVTFVAGLIETAVVCATTVFAWMSIRKFRDSRGIDFVINVESTLDPLDHSLLHAPPPLIRSIFQHYDLSSLNDLEVQAFPYMYSTYLQVARMCFMLCDESMDLGLSKKARKEMLQLWLDHLVDFKHHSAMQLVHAESMKLRNFNKAFLERAEAVMR